MLQQFPAPVGHCLRYVRRLNTARMISIILFQTASRLPHVPTVHSPSPLNEQGTSTKQSLRQCPQRPLSLTLIILRGQPNRMACSYCKSYWHLFPDINVSAMYKTGTAPANPTKVCLTYNL